MKEKNINLEYTEETQVIDANFVQPHVLELQERAQTDIQINTAKKWPRDISQVKKQMLSFATLDIDTAAGCFYSLPRTEKDGSIKNIQGPSVRLAEIAMSSFGNLKAASRIIDNDGKTITAQAVCHDLQNNVCVSIETKRKITNKYGKSFSEDMQVVTGNAACAIALRNAVFKIVPMALIKPVYEAAKLVAIGDAKTLKSRVEMALDRLNKMGISQEQVLDYLQKTGVDAIDIADLENLFGVTTAIKDGTCKIEEVFPIKPKVSKPIYDDKGSFITPDPKVEGEK